MAHEVRQSMEKDDDGMLTREEREALLDRKIQMMKLKNEERMKKFKEIEEDKKWAEREGCAVSLKNASTFNDDDDSWPLRTDRFTEDRAEEQVDLRKVLQQKRGESRTAQEQPVPSRQQGSSKYASILEDGPPPDPVYNYLADHGRDKPVGERVRRNPRGHLGPRNSGPRANHPRHDQFSGQPHRYNGDDSLHEENTAGYDHWRKERENIDRERIERQKTNEGWKREWDRDKAENQKEQRSYRQAGQQSLEEPHALPSSGDSYSRGTSYRGGRGRGRPKQDLRGSSPRAGLTPEREFGTTVQEPPPRFRRSPEDSRPGAIALAQANSRGSSVGGNSPRNWPNAQRPVASIQSQQQWPHPKTGADLKVYPTDSELIPSSKNTDFSPRNSTVITVGNRPQAENGVRSIIRVIQNDAPSRQERPIKSEVELLARDQFVKCPKKGIGSGRLLPPSKERVASRGKSANRKIITAKGKRTGSRWVEKDNEPVTIGIAVITTPGDKEEIVAEKVESDSDEVSPVVEERHPDVSPPKKDISKSEAVTRQIEFVGDEADNYDDDDDEWEDTDGSWADVDEKIGGEHNKSNESIDRFIEENTLHPDGTNWNIDDDTADIPWSEQVDAESQERHHMENDWMAMKQRPSFSNLDTGFQSSCSIVESPFEQSEILSSLLAAACDPSAKEELDLKPAAEESCTESKRSVARDPSPSDARVYPTTTADEKESCSESSRAAESTSNDLRQDTTIGLSSESQPSSSLADISPSTAFAPLELPLQSVCVEPSGESQFPLVVPEQPNSGLFVPAELICSQPESMQSAVSELNDPPEASAMSDAKATLSAISEPSRTTDTSTEASATATQSTALEPSGPVDTSAVSDATATLSAISEPSHATSAVPGAEATLSAISEPSHATDTSTEASVTAMQFAVSELSGPADTSAVSDATATLSAISEPSHATDTSTEASATATQSTASEPCGPTDKPHELVTDLSALKPEPAAGLAAREVHQSASETTLSQPEGLQSQSEEVTCLNVGSALLPLQSAEETLSPESSHTDEKNSEVKSTAVQEI